ncbi:AraC family transcriptional regulator [Paenibacillus sp. S150]|uniref:AraC family transcriptional regulator n=1 Tax=Paenibacillus sp. S150 TaxID=2749826 RepID=UPI001C584043|nr:AraC family transcriptional regulator [Paenibacillus sp. S150]MBW4080653.1 AraC family transcriptional regulator [Paenibacillus sp. S150]
MEVFPVFTGEYLFDSCSPVQLLLTQETLTSVRHQHDFLELAYVVEGEGIHMVAGDKMQVAKGDLFVIPPGVSHVFQPQDLSGSRPLLILNCMLGAELFRLPAELQEQASQEDTVRLTRLHGIKNWFGYKEKNRELALLFSRMQEIHNSASRESQLQLYALLFELVSLILPYAAVPFAQQPQPPEDPLHDVILYMVSNFRQRISLKDISRRIAMSSRQFQRLFKLKTGKSYIQMLQEIRMKYSCALLMFTELGIQNIALEVGIGDMKYFYRLFREYSGMTPANYRNKLHSHFLSPKELMSSAEYSSH